MPADPQMSGGYDVFTGHPVFLTDHLNHGAGAGAGGPGALGAKS